MQDDPNMIKHVHLSGFLGLWLITQNRNWGRVLSQVWWHSSTLSFNTFAPSFPNVSQARAHWSRRSELSLDKITHRFDVALLVLLEVHLAARHWSNRFRCQIVSHRLLLPKVRPEGGNEQKQHEKISRWITDRQAMSRYDWAHTFLGYVHWVSFRYQKTERSMWFKVHLNANISPCRWCWFILETCPTSWNIYHMDYI